MNRKILATAICAGLFVTGGAWAQDTGAQPQDQTTSTQSQPTSTNEKPKTLQSVVVTGSLIPQAQIETANPVITLSSQKLESQGFGTVYDALRHLSIATGAVQDNQTASGGFTPGAQTISLLGLDPGFTLYLINGHPMSDYPLLYNGQSNFVDLSDIPVGMVDHIDVLPGNQSSIYGSSAIAGVINIILKDHIDGYELNLRGGGYTGGGGSNERLEFLGGHSWGKLDATFGIQLSNQQPIWGYQRKLTSSSAIGPDPNTNVASRNYLLFDELAGAYIDPGSLGLGTGPDVCSAVSSQYGGTVSYQFRPNRGYYCGSTAVTGYSTLLNKNRAGTGYLNLKYQLNDNAELYANVLYNFSNVQFSGGPYGWFGVQPNQPYLDPNLGTFVLAQHLYAPEEIGNWDLYSTHDFERTYNAWAGVRGSFANSDWNYDMFFARSEQKLTEKQWWPLGNASTQFFENQFLGPQQGTYYGYPIFTPNYANLYKAITPAQYATFNGLIESHNSTYTQNFNIQLTNQNLFELPAGAVGFAGLFQYGGQSWQNPADPRLVAGDFYGLTGTSGGGTRNNWAYAGELRVPIFKMLTADISARYDQYSNNGGGNDGRATYKATLEFRPIDTLLFRANYGTAFRAPDMSYTFGGQSGAYQPGLTDYYLCALNQPTTPLQDCKYYANQDPFILHSGNLNLKSVTAKSWGAGVVWSPTQNFDIKADYYNVKIANEVQLQDQDELLKQDSACRLGQLDPNSPTCLAVESEVIRGPNSGPLPLNLQQINVMPINVASEHVSGILASLNYKYDMGRYGSLGFGAQYNVTLKHSFQQYPYDPTIDLLRDPFFSSEFKTIANASLTWDIGQFETTLFGTRFGKTPNFYSELGPSGYETPCSTDSAGYTQCPGKVAPWMIYNASVSYNLTPDMKITGIVNNIKNSMPPKDPSNNSSPYYNILNYNAYGRQFWLEFDWKFGRSSN